MYLYRYLSFERFNRLLSDKKLYFANPFIDWEKEDNHEGFMYRFANEINNPEWEKFLSTKEYKYVKEKIKYGCIYSEDKKTEKLDWFGMRCLCWCKTKCSDEMAKKYNADVCIEVESADLLNLHYENKKVEGFDVKYDNYTVESIRKSFDTKRKIFYFQEILRIKAECYRFENEYRSYIVLLDENGHLTNESKGILVDIDVNKFVKKVYINRKKTSKEVKKNIKNLCKNFEIKMSKWDNLPENRI